jgi:hypothetical protein
LRPLRAAAVPVRRRGCRLFRWPFAPGAIGFRAMTKVPYNGQPYAGAQVAAYLGAQSVIQRLNAVVPGRWRQQFQSVPAEFVPAGTRRIYLACRLIVTLPLEEGGPDIDALYEDLGEMDQASLAGVKALYSDARKRAAVAAGIGAYLYTSLEAVVLPIGPNARQVQAIRRQGKSDLLVLSPETDAPEALLAYTVRETSSRPWPPATSPSRNPSHPSRAQPSWHGERHGRRRATTPGGRYQQHAAAPTRPDRGESYVGEAVSAARGRAAKSDGANQQHADARDWANPIVRWGPKPDRSG